MLPSEIPRLATDPPVRVFPGVWKLLFFKTPFPGWISVPLSSVSLFIFYIFSYFLSKTMGCLSRCLMSSASIQKLFCGICSAFTCSFDEFVGEKVVSPSYSSAILGPPFKNLVCVGHWPRALAASLCHQLFMHFYPHKPVVCLPTHSSTDQAFRAKKPNIYLFHIYLNSK